MPAPKGNQNAKGNRGGGRKPVVYLKKYVLMARRAAEAGFTDIETADLLGISVDTLRKWRLGHVEFDQALKGGKSSADDRVAACLYHRAIGYTFEAVKIMKGADGEPIAVPYREHVPPDTTAAMFWLKNRRKDEWRDRQELSLPDGATAAVKFIIERAE